MLLVINQILKTIVSKIELKDFPEIISNAPDKL